METTIRTRASRADAESFLRSLPAILSGNIADPWGIAEAVQASIVRAIMEKMQHTFHEKSLGGTGDFGEAWKQLAPETVIDRLDEEEKFNTPVQTVIHRRAKGVLKQYFVQKFTGMGMTPEIAKKRASEEVEIVKKHGVLPQRFSKAVPILVEEGSLAQHVRPGDLVGHGLNTTYTEPEPQERSDGYAAEQTVKYRPGAVDIQFGDPDFDAPRYHGKWHQSEQPRHSNLPRRAYIPDEMPDAWLEYAVEKATETLQDCITEVLRNWQT